MTTTASSMFFAASRILLAISLLTAATAQAAAIQKEGFWHDGLYRTYLFYIPDTVQPEAPLLVSLHGHSSNADVIAEYNNGEMRRIADREGFAIAWPNGATSLGPIDTLRAWNAGACCTPAKELGVNDRGFIHSVVERMGSKLSIDPTRVYATGHSNGAIMSHRLGLQSADTFAAIAPFSFQLSDNWSWRIPHHWYPDRAVAQLEMHAPNDELIPYEGRIGLQPGLWLDSTREGLENWGRISGCSGTPMRSNHPGAGAFRDTYISCRQGVQVELLTVGDGGHFDIHTTSENGGVELQEEIWGFLSRYSKPGHESDRLWNGQELERGQYLQSDNNRYRLSFQNDGNLVLRDRHTGAVLWASGTNGQRADRLVMQGDANLVIYSEGYWGWKSWWRWGWIEPKAIWASHTVGGGESRLELSDAGRLSIIRNNAAVWQRH
jgi:polyhydroxybutyrate depolymerase